MLHFVKCVVGAGQITGKRTYKGHHTPSFTYQITNRQAMDLLKQVAVYLKSYKAARAELALEQYIRLTPRNGRYTLVQKHEREKFEQEFLRLLPKKIEASSLARGSYFSASGSDVGTFHVLSEALRELGRRCPSVSDRVRQEIKTLRINLLNQKNRCRQ